MPAPYPEEFRREAVRLLKSSGTSVPQLASELGVSPQSLRNWAGRSRSMRAARRA
jgi:transposase